MNTPFLTIITPCFNPGEKLNRTLDSILRQTFQDYEVIVKDGGSSDGSLESLPKDRRIRLVRHRDHGIYDGMNEAVASANGEYYYFLNCGDVLHDTVVLEKVAEAIEQDGAAHGIYYGDVIEVKTGQRVAANPEMDHFAMFRNLPCHQACFYNRNLFSKRAFDTKYLVRADYEHFLWCVMKEGASTRKVPFVIADYEGGGFSETKENRKRSAAEHRTITEQYFSTAELRQYRRTMLLTLQPLREKLAGSRLTAGLYDRIKSAVYRYKEKKSD